MVASIKILKFMSAAVYQIKRSIQCLYKQKIFKFWLRCHATGIIIIIGSWILGSIKPLKFMSTTVFQIEKICVQGNRNFLVLMMQLYNKDRHDYRVNDGCFHEFVAIHINNSFSSKQKKSAFKQIEIFLSWWRHHANSAKVIIEWYMVTSAHLKSW